MSNRAQTAIQAALETTHGTAVGASKLIFAHAEFPQEVPNVVDIRKEKNDFNAIHDSVVTHKHVPDWQFTIPALHFDEMPFWFHLWLEGNVNAGGVGPYSWVFDSEAAMLESATFEIGDGEAVLQVPYCMAKSWEITGAMGATPTPLTASCNLFGQKTDDKTTLTSTTPETAYVGGYGLAANTQLFIDDAHGDIGNTEWGTLASFKLSMDNAITPDFFGGDSLLFTSHGRAERHLEFEAVVDFDSTAESEFFNKFRFNTKRFIQLKNTGSGNDILTVNLATKLHAYPFSSDGPKRRVGLFGRAHLDLDLAYAWQVTVQNDSNSI